MSVFLFLSIQLTEKIKIFNQEPVEKKIQADHFEQLATNGGNMTVLELVENIHQPKLVSDLLQLEGPFFLKSSSLSISK